MLYPTAVNICSLGSLVETERGILEGVLAFTRTLENARKIRLSECPNERRKCQATS